MPMVRAKLFAVPSGSKANTVSVPTKSSMLSLKDPSPPPTMTIGAALIYMSFEWDKVDEAYAAVFKLAGKHGVGFFDVSSDLAETWLPDAKGGLYIAHGD